MSRWLLIPGFEHHEVSDDGRVRSLGRWVRNNQGQRFVSGRMKTLRRHSSGYICVGICEAGRSRDELVHRLVVEAFIGPLPRRKRRAPIGPLEVNHLNGDKTDNRRVNLERVSRQVNRAHAMRTGLLDNKGEKNSQAKLTDELVRAIRARHADGLGYKRLSREFGLPLGLVRGPASGRSWTHVR